MKTINTLFASALFASMAFTGTAQAEQLWDDALYNTIHPESADIFNIGDYNKSAPASIRSYGDDYNKDSVWSSEFEEYVNPANYHQNELADTGDVNQYMDSNPTAAGSSSQNVFIYNELAGEYHLQ